MAEPTAGELGLADPETAVTEPTPEPKTPAPAKPTKPPAPKCHCKQLQRMRRYNLRHLALAFGAGGIFTCILAIIMQRVTP